MLILAQQFVRRTLDDTSRDWKLSANAGEIRIYVACGLTTLVDAPVYVRHRTADTISNHLPNDQTLTPPAVTGSKDTRKVGRVLSWWCFDVLASIELDFSP
jgi:hypothetical protein